MPELPEVQIFKQYFECKFLDQKINDLKITNKKILGNISESKLKERLIGSKFKSAHRYGNMKRVLETAINLNAEIERYPNSYLSKNRSKFGSCPQCNTMIERINISGRSTYFCPSCQKRIIS